MNLFIPPFFYAGESIYGYPVEGGNGTGYVGLRRLLRGRRGEEKDRGPPPPPISHRTLRLEKGARGTCSAEPLLIPPTYKVLLKLKYNVI